MTAINSTATGLLIRDALDEYLKKGFGSMTKNDFEVWIFHQLLQDRLTDKSNYEISRELRIPEAKVKTLQYNASLKYSSEKDDDYLKRINDCLKNCIFKKNGEQIQFVIEDISTRKFLDSLLKKGNRFSDSSFNSEIVSIGLDDLEYLLCKNINSQQQVNEIINNAKKTLGKDISFKNVLKAIADLCLKKDASDVINLTIEGIKEQIKKITKSHTS